MMNKQLLTSNNQNEQQGFVLLFAIVVSAVIFFIGAGIFSIAYKELIISSLGKDSQKSIFMADSAMECALREYARGTFDKTKNYASISTGGIKCFGDNTDIESSSSNDFIAFRWQPEKETGCARVSVDKTTSETIFFAQGYNQCSNGSPVENSPSLTERVYRVSF